MTQINSLTEATVVGISAEEILKSIGEALQAEFLMQQIINYLESLKSMTGSFNYRFQVPELPKKERIQRWGTALIRGSKISDFREIWNLRLKARTLEIFWTAQAGQIIRMNFFQNSTGWTFQSVTGATEQMEGVMFKQLHAWASENKAKIFHMPAEELRKAFE